MSNRLLIRESDGAILRWQAEDHFVISDTDTTTASGEVIAMGSGVVQQVSTTDAVPDEFKPLAYKWENGTLAARDPDPPQAADLLPPELEEIELDEGRKRVPAAKFQQVFLTRQEALRLELFALGEDEVGQSVEQSARQAALLVKGYFGTTPYINLDRPQHQDLIQGLADAGVLLGDWRVAQILAAQVPTDTNPNIG